MDEYKEEIQKKLDSLPTEVRNLVYSPEMDAVLKQVATKHQLHIDQLGVLETESAAVMIGITEPGEFVQNLIEGLSIENLKAPLIAQDINDQLFSKIRESMKQLYPSSKPVTPAAPAQPPAMQSQPQTPPQPISTSQPTQPAPAPTHELAPVDLMLEQPTVTTAPAPASTPTPQTPTTAPQPPQSPTTPPKPDITPKSYATDPYREPPTP